MIPMVNMRIVTRRRVEAWTRYMESPCLNGSDDEDLRTIAEAVLTNCDDGCTQFQSVQNLNFCPIRVTHFHRATKHDRILNHKYGRTSVFADQCAFWHDQ